jgi:hypothetical protein
VLKQRTKEGKVWYPARILEELWELWPERPPGPGRKKEFVEQYKQLIGRLRRGITDSTRDELLFGLIERFVAKHASPGDFTPLGRDIRRLVAAFEALNAFAFPTPLQPNWDIRALFGTPRGGKLDTSPPRMFVVRIPGPRRDGGDEFRAPWIAPIDDDREIHDRFLAVSAPDVARGYFPAVLFDQHFAYYEIGFFVLPLQFAFLRTPLAIAGRFDHEKIGENTKSWSINGCVRVLEVAYLDANRDCSVWETGVTLTDLETKDPLVPSRFTMQYRCTVDRSAELQGFASKLLNFLDVPGSAR